MSDITVRDLAESDWPSYRALRLAALQESPDAFVETYADESQQRDEFWSTRVGRTHRFVAEQDSDPVGVVALGTHGDSPANGEVFDLWVAPTARKARIAVALVDAAARQAVREGRTRLFFWVLSDSVPAIAFASSYGFRPTSKRRLTTRDREDEVAMVMSLEADPHAAPNPWIP